MSGTEQSCSKAEPCQDPTAGDGEPGVWQHCLVEMTCDMVVVAGEARLPWHALTKAVPFECKSCGLLAYLCVCVLGLSCRR